jgi:REP element-mobilizing transposase RayT
VTAKSPSGRLLFIDDRARQVYLQLVAREVREREWSVLTYCLMTNHMHVLVRTPSPDLGLGFKRINEDFARYVNGSHDLGGHLFGERFYSGLVQNDRHAVGCLRYIARNPVAAGICASADAWAWSAHPSLAGIAAPPTFLDVPAAYELLSSNHRDARTAYRQLVACSDRSLLANLVCADPDRWLLDAVDNHAISVGEIAAFLNRTTSSVYRRIAAARATVGTVPGVALAEG